MKMNNLLYCLVVLSTILLMGCNNSVDNSRETNSTTEINTLETTTEDDNKASVPDIALSYGTSINIYRCIEVDGQIEYHYNNVPFEYKGVDVRYYCTSDFRYDFKNKYEQDSIECMALLYYDGQYIPFSINDSDAALSHVLTANNDMNDEYYGNYLVDFEFSFSPCGITKETVDIFYIIIVPLFPLSIQDGMEVIDVMPIRVASLKGRVESSDFDSAYVEYTSVMKDELNSNKTEINEFAEEIHSIRKGGVNDEECVLLNENNMLKSVTLINKKRERLDNTIITIAICDNSIMSAFSDKEMLIVDTKEDGIIKSYIDTSTLDKGKHTIFTVTIIKDNIKDSIDIYRSNFVDIVVE